ncbi:uncharacterized protein J3R85_014383 [Psidium guajava]|nr:uncharacterized protein J3R85_014383 [Psidium guajava]
MGLVDLPPGKSVVGCRWVCKIQTEVDGIVDCNKARLVAMGFTQEYGIGYETFALVACFASVCSLIAVAAVKHWPWL